MKFTKFAAAAIAGAMLLTGCGNTATNNETNTEQSAAAGAALTIGDVEVSPGVFTFYFKNFSDQLEDADEAKDRAIEYCEDGFQYIAVAKAMGIELSDEDQSEMAEYKEQVKESYGDDGYEDFLKENSLSDEDIDTIISVNYYADALKDKIEDKEYTDEEKQEFFKENYRRAKHILVSIDDDTSDAEAKKKAEELLKQAEDGADFDALISENGEDPGMASNPDGYVFTDGTMVQEFQDGVDSIEPGEFTLVKTSYGYHVIQRLALDETPEFFKQEYDKIAEEIGDAMDTKRFGDQMEEWKEEYNIQTVTNDDAIKQIIKEAK